MTKASQKRNYDQDRISPEVPPSTFSRAEWLASVLRDRIVKGIYKPGDRIRENELQQEFQLSNGPVREAIQKLVGDCILERAPWRGARVVELTYFGGMNAGELAPLLAVSVATVERDLAFGRAWLKRRLAR